jgi:hypothetical protein
MYWLALASLASVVAAGRSNDTTDISCPIVFDGRVPLVADGKFFANGSLPYNKDYVIGANLTWAEALAFPSSPKAALFDNSTSKPVEVLIDDRSIFTPSPTNRQTGFRRAELQPQPVNVNGSVTGIKTLHFSIKTDDTRPLNYTHEYSLVWLENAEYSANQFTISTGKFFDSNSTSAEEHQSLYLVGNNAAGVGTPLWKTKFTPGVWHNFGIVLDFASNRVEVLYSTRDKQLKRKTNFIANDLTKLGQYHVGILKKPTGPGGIDVTKQGYQTPGIHEGVVYGGVFLEDSANGCVSVQPGVKGRTTR